MREVQTDAKLRVQGWAHPREGLSIDELAVRIKQQSPNHVLEVHRQCVCVGANTEGVADDHILVIDAEAR